MVLGHVAEVRRGQRMTEAESIALTELGLDSGVPVPLLVERKKRQGLLQAPTVGCRRHELTDSNEPPSAAGS